jgi:hypothetical protein
LGNLKIVALQATRIKKDAEKVGLALTILSKDDSAFLE